MDNLPKKETEDVSIEKVSGGLSLGYSSSTDSHDKIINAPISISGNGNTQTINGGVNFNQGDSNSTRNSSGGIERSALDWRAVFKDW